MSPVLQVVAARYCLGLLPSPRAVQRPTITLPHAAHTQPSNQGQNIGTSRFGCQRQAAASASQPRQASRIGRGTCFSPLE
jgi:hypothetical protein